jgi:hypothetical protein
MGKNDIIPVEIRPSGAAEASPQLLPVVRKRVVTLAMMAYDCNHQPPRVSDGEIKFVVDAIKETGSYKADLATFLALRDAYPGRSGTEMQELLHGFGPDSDGRVGPEYRKHTGIAAFGSKITVDKPELANLINLTLLGEDTVYHASAAAFMLMPFGPKVRDIFDANEKALEHWSYVYTNIESEVVKFIQGCTSVGQALHGWPEVEHLLTQDMTNGVKPDSQSRALMHLHPPTRDILKTSIVTARLLGII